MVPAAELLAFVPPFAIGKTPVTPVVSGSPVALVSTAAEGVPSAGVVSVGDVAKTTFPVPVAPLAVTPPIEISVPNVWSALQVCARFNSASVPVLAGKVAVTDPRAPVVGESVMDPEVPLSKITEPTEVPATPKVMVDVPFVVRPAAVKGAVPAPPPNTMPFAAKSADDDSCVVELK